MSNIKTCFRCKEQKDITDFYVHKQMGDGYLGICKKCVIERAKNNPNRMINDKKRYQNPKRKEYIKKLSKIWKKNNPEKVKTQNIFYKAIQKEKIKREKCIVCKIPKAHGHHPDYSKPFEVIWLCILHHNQLHSGKIKI